MKLDVFLRLGRVSNLPTVWSNALAGATLAGAAFNINVLWVGFALSFFYIGGMWLNDAFDAEIDAKERANRPIPNGEVDKTTVFIGGAAMLGIGIILIFFLAPLAGLAAIGLALAVVLYDWLHKRTVLSPVLMGMARFFCYVVAAAAVGGMSWQAFIGALGLFAYVNGLTYAAKQEAYDRLDNAWPLLVLAAPVALAFFLSFAAPVSLIFTAALIALIAFALRLLFRRRPGDVPRAVVTLIAGISLFDAAMIAAAGSFGLALVAAGCFALTIYLQRIAPGT